MMVCEVNIVKSEKLPTTNNEKLPCTTRLSDIEKEVFAESVKQNINIVHVVGEVMQFRAIAVPKSASVELLPNWDGVGGETVLKEYTMSNTF